MIEYLRHRIWAPEICHWLNISVINHFTFPVPQFALWVFHYVLLQSTLRTALALLPSLEVLGLGTMLELAVNQNIFIFLYKYDDLVLF